MTSELNRSAYEQLVREDLEWLRSQPRTLEREHIEMIVRWSVERIYGPPAYSDRPFKPGSAL